MNKNIWSEVHSPLPCPHCLTGYLEQDDKYLLTETLDSLENNEFHKKGQVYPETIYLGSRHLHCSKCNDIVVMTFKMIDDVRHVDEEGNEISIIEPLSYFPAPKIINIPDSCPLEIKNILNQSFILFWIDLSSCGNKIRTSIEALMDIYSILSSSNNLHMRIEKFKTVNQKVSDYLLSIKWIGNAGSHLSGISKEAILDAYELLEYSLELLYNDREKKLDQLSQRINANRRH